VFGLRETGKRKIRNGSVCFLRMMKWRERRKKRVKMREWRRFDRIDI